MWNTILGHKSQVEFLKQTLSKKRSPNAMLFSGPEGIGKSLLAKIYVCALLCQHESKPCGNCVSCRKVVENIHPDFFLLAPLADESIKIDEIRELTSRLHFHPLEGEKKCVVLDDAEHMTESAANALLKTLEEPPKHTHFILVSSQCHKLLPTIRSRCQQMTFQPIPSRELEEFLKREHSYQTQDAKKIAELSQGSLGLALQLTPQTIASTLDRFSFLMKEGTASDIMATSEEWSKTFQEVPLLLDILSFWYRDQLVLQGREPSAPPFPIRQLEKGFYAIRKTRSGLETTANKQLLFEQLLFSLNDL